MRLQWPMKNSTRTGFSISLSPASLLPWSTLLQVMTSPLSRSLSLAPVEEEDLTAEAAEALESARVSLARGEGVAHEHIRREFGLEK